MEETNKKNRVALYVRISPGGKKEEKENVATSVKIQLNALRKFAEAKDWTVVKEYIDEFKSGKNIKERPSFQQLMEDIPKNLFDIVLCYRLDRFGRSTKDLLKSAEFLKDNNIAFACSMQPIDTSSTIGMLFYTILAAIAEFERNNLLEKTAIGKAYAREKGKKFGPKYKKIDHDMIEALREKGFSYAKIAKKIGVAPNTIRTRLLKLDKIKEAIIKEREFKK